MTRQEHEQKLAECYFPNNKETVTPNIVHCVRCRLSLDLEDPCSMIYRDEHMNFLCALCGEKNRKAAARLKRRYVECPYKRWDEDEKSIGFI